MTDQLSTSYSLPALPPPLPPPEIDPSHLSVDSLKVVARLRRHGHVAYLVGGCVRDLLVGVSPKDYDVATSAHPEQIRDIFRNSRLIGRRFRLAHVYFADGNFVEVATFRATPVQDTEATGDEPADLLLTDDNLFGTAEEDALRRDFTVNGLFYDVIAGQVIDYVGGREDLAKKSIRTIGDPEIRLREDPVRGLRAARIAAKLGFSIEQGTFDAMERHAGELPRCAPARVLEETLKLLRSGAASKAFALLRKAGILRVLLPPIEEVLVQGGPAAEQSFLTRLAALDELVGEGESVSDAVMLATLLSFLPPRELVRKPEAAESEEEEEEPDDLAATLPSADQVLAQMSAQARLPRRVADRVRMIIGSQRFFLAPQKKKRRKSGGFVRTPHFPEALQLFAIGVRATGEHKDVQQRWITRFNQQSSAAEAQHVRELVAAEAAPAAPAAPAPAAEAAPAPAADAETAAKKRRRRGGRRHRKGPKPETNTPPSPPAGDGPAT